MNWRDNEGFVGITALAPAHEFVGLPPKQSLEIAIAAASQNCAAIAAELVATSAADPVIRTAMTRQRLGQASSMTADERAAPASTAYANLVSFWDTHLQYRNGFVSEETWAGTREPLKRSLWDKCGGPGLRTVYKLTASDWSPPLARLVEQLIDEIEAEGLSRAGAQPARN